MVAGPVGFSDFVLGRRRTVVIQPKQEFRQEEQKMRNTIVVTLGVLLLIALALAIIPQHAMKSIGVGLLTGTTRPAVGPT